MTVFQPLYSGSSGNCSLVTNDLCGHGGALLIDAGVSCRAILEGLSQAQVQPCQLSGILITHEHSDHIKGLRVFAKRFRTPVYASPEVLAYLQQENYLPEDYPAFALSEPAEISGMLVSPFDTPHDSVHSLGFRIDTAQGKSIGIATDLGTVTESVRAGLMGCDLAMVESNYDASMLECSSYPYYLKRRIRGNYGHLDNLGCAEELAELAKAGTRQFVLCHLSEENNLPELALQTVYGRLAQDGISAGDFRLQAACRQLPSPQMIL